MEMENDQKTVVVYKLVSCESIDLYGGCSYCCKISEIEIVGSNCKVQEDNLNATYNAFMLLALVSVC